MPAAPVTPALAVSKFEKTPVAPVILPLTFKSAKFPAAPVTPVVTFTLLKYPIPETPVTPKFPLTVTSPFPAIRINSLLLLLLAPA